MKLRKIKDFTKKGNVHERTEKQKEAVRKSATIRLLTNNPMKNKNLPKKVRRHVISKPFNKGNKLSGFKGKKHSEQTKLIIGIKNSGRKRAEKDIKIAKERFLKENPMKNPEFVKRYKESRRNGKIARTKEKRRKLALSREGFKKNQFKPKFLITDQLKLSIVSYYKNGQSLSWLHRKTKLSINTIRKILVSEGIKIRGFAFYSKHRKKKEVK